MVLKIAFLDFWTGFKANSNFFLDFLRLNFEGVTLVHPKKADVIFHSVFGQERQKFSAIKILYTGEDISYLDFDSNFALSFDDASMDLRNFRLPLWMLQLQWFSKNNYGNPNFVCEIDRLMNPRLNSKERPIYLTGIFNHDKAENRLSTMARLMANGKTQFFGEPFGNHFWGERKKLSILTKSKFNLCFENSNSYGYHTEKLIHAKYAGCVPIYWANSKSVIEDFNINSFLFLNDPKDPNEVDGLIDKIRSESFIDHLRSEPLFDKVPTLEPLSSYFNNILGTFK